MEDWGKKAKVLVVCAVSRDKWRKSNGKTMTAEECWLFNYFWLASYKYKWATPYFPLDDKTAYYRIGAIKINGDLPTVAVTRQSLSKKLDLFESLGILITVRAQPETEGSWRYWRLTDKGCTWLSYGDTSVLAAPEPVKANPKISSAGMSLFNFKLALEGTGVSHSNAVAYADLRKAKNAPLAQAVVDQLIAQAKHHDCEVGFIVEQCVMNGWKALTDEYLQKVKPKKVNVPRPFSQE